MSLWGHGLHRNGHSQEDGGPLFVMKNAETERLVPYCRRTCAGCRANAASLPVAYSLSEPNRRMRCTDCDQTRVGARRGVRLRNLVPRIGRLSLLYCDQCGGPLAPPDTTETLLAKLSQLARFGLSAGATPILCNRESGGADSDIRR
jgi:hypothetical protein